MLDRILSPFIGYWYWAQERQTPLSKAVALGAPLVVFGLVLYVLFGRGGGGSNSLLTEATGTQGNVAINTQSVPTQIVPTQPPATGAQPTTSTTSTGSTGSIGTGSQTAASPTTAATSGTATPAPTAFTQEHYTVAAGDTPGGIAAKVGVPENSRASWIQEMLALNGATATTLQVGQQLILPPF